MTRVCSLLLFVVLIAGCQEKNVLPPPNILWIVSEDNSPFLGCYGDSMATTPNLDKLAERSIRYTRAYANSPVCAPSRFTLITGMYPTKLGTEHMRSNYKIPSHIRFFPSYLRQSGYYTTNNNKKDYNTIDQPEAWDESSKEAHYSNRSKSDQPFFHIINLNTTHEGKLHRDSAPKNHDPVNVVLPPYHADTEPIRKDWAVYYDRVEEMDQQVGEVLAQLERDGLSENTIIFYYSDHGGVLPRSKRFLFESGLKVPLLVHIPKRYAHLSPQRMGTTSDRLISFVDFAPTLLSLAGTTVPGHMQGKPFLGAKITQPSDYAFAFRGRMDERIDLSRSVTDGRFRYTRNYLPHRPYAQHLQYLWRAPAMQSLEKKYVEGKLDKIQSAFFEPKPYEELYDLNRDPHNVLNLAKSSQHEEVKTRLSDTLDQWLLTNQDKGLIPEAQLSAMDETGIISGSYFSDQTVKVRMKVAKWSADADTPLDSLLAYSEHPDAATRYWAISGFLNQKELPNEVRTTCENALNDEFGPVVVVGAEVLLGTLAGANGMSVILDALEHSEMLVRLQALNVLEVIGEEARVAIPVIQRLVKPANDRSYDNRAMIRILEKFHEENEGS